MPRLIFIALCVISLGAEPTTKPIEFRNADEILALFPDGSFPETNDGWTDAKVKGFPDARYDKVLDHTCRFVFTLTEVTVTKPSPIVIAGNSIAPSEIQIEGFMPISLRVKGMRVKLSAVFLANEKTNAMVAKCQRNEKAVIEGMAFYAISKDEVGRFLLIRVRRIRSSRANERPVSDRPLENSAETNSAIG